MNPSEKGWLKEYLKYRTQYPIDFGTDALKSEDAMLYKVVQPTGLIYGHPLHAPSIRHPKEQRWNSLGKMKVVLLESFLHSAALKMEIQPSSLEDWAAFYWETAGKIGHFYECINPEKHKKSFFTFTKKKTDDYKFAENALRKNLFPKSRWDYFWANLFQNSLLFLDTYYFGEWNANRFNSIKWHKDAMKIMLLKVLAAAAHSNNIIEREEKNMFFSFLSSANLTKGQRDLLKDAFRDGITLDQIDLKHADTWLLKKYVLELAVLMIWSDNKIEEQEKAFLLKLSSLLGFTETDLEVSLIAIEAFVIENWKEVYFLQSKHSYQVIGETIIGRLKQVILKNMDSIIKRINESEELFKLVNKSKKEQLTEEESERLRVQMIDVLKTIPAFVIIDLPSNFLTTPVLMKILPKEVLTSNFQA